MLIKNAVAMLQRHGTDYGATVDTGSIYHYARIGNHRVGFFECGDGTASAILSFDREGKPVSFTGRSLARSIEWCQLNTAATQQNLKPARSVLRGTYRHYKGSVYTVIGVASHSETMERLVIYQCEQGKLWARPESMFTDIVFHAGQAVRRFTRFKPTARTSKEQGS